MPGAARICSPHRALCVSPAQSRWGLSRGLGSGSTRMRHASRPLVVGKCALRAQVLVRGSDRPRFVRAPRATNDSGDLDLDLDSLTPDIDGDLKSLQEEAGAVFSEENPTLPLTFGNDAEAIDAMQKAMTVVDRSHWGRIRVSEADRIDFLQNQTTADFKSLKAGQGTDTVFSTPQGRALDLATALVNENSVMLIVSPTEKDGLIAKMNKFIFMADRVKVDDVSERTCMFSLLGPDSYATLSRLQAGAVLDATPASHAVLNFMGSPLMVVVGGGLPMISYTLIIDEAAAPDLWTLLLENGAVPGGEQAWEQARVLSGRPAAGKELTKEFNVLEAGLYQAASLNKGCYLGQEALAKVYIKAAVKQQLWGVELEGEVSAGMELTDGAGKRCGVVTSYTPTPSLGSGHFALAYVRCRKDGKQVRVEASQVTASNGIKGIVTQIPFPTRDFAAASKPKQKEEEQASEDAADDKEAKKAADAERKAKKMAEMQARLDAYMAAQAEAKGE
eukprot:CAMPEP_0198200442 /NCGR_PEP_ID=MMETSP1445-20131203/3454_1 /TAXON_ID=36898 /ORGANISM="Pyramimonas sp., Strain CCMP2087" /LENGTH=503 /DNA_ID=CAMNT_0043870513 /DNA_START=131 /DNA_END=1642 /DNA_ORIENTATION=+